ncbi:MAG: NAD(P)/FAD-dependent oxidoreductase [Proteobacteria bacterium]|nr:NAD(P)/FAD-dependent oxidoreductase [Pseudomonadota bacterium]
MSYDVAVVGAGPAGLMAAKTAAEHGLRTVLIEKRNDVSKITRACCQQFIMDENFQGETIRIEEGKIVFTKNGFDVAYSGLLLNVTDKYFVSPGGHAIHFTNNDNSPIVVKFDKGLLLRGIWDTCNRLGVTLRNAALVCNAEETSTGVELTVHAGGISEKLHAKKLIVADGVNSRTAEKLGLNQGRMCFATALCTLSVIEGLQDFEPCTLKSYMGGAYQSCAPLIMGPSLEGSDLRYLVIIGNKNKRPEQIYHDIVTRSPLASMFANARVVKKMACMATAYSSMKIPYRGNTLVIGDAAAYVEVETQGALTCGFRAGSAVYKELSGKGGFAEYTGWWQDSFEFNSDDYLQVAQGFALVPTYSDDEIDYLFSLIEDETLEGTYNQYKSPRLMWGAFLRHKERIARERPELHRKILTRKLSLSDVL